MADIAWSQADFIARPLCRMWPKKLHPVIATNPSRLVVAAGSTLYSYSFSDNPDVTSPKMSLEGSVSLLDDPESPRNITAISFLPDGGEDRTLLVTFQDGAIDQVVLNAVHGSTDDSEHGHDHPSSIYVSKTTREVLTKDYIESISAPRDSSTLLTLSSYNTATLYRQNPNDPNDLASVSTLKLGGTTRSWTCLLSPKSSTPYALFGTASSTPLNLHLITESSILPNPSAILHTHKAEERKLAEMSALPVYGIAHGPPCSPWGSSPYIIVSGWYDGQVRCYDLRTPSILSPELPSSTSEVTTPALHRPVLSLADRWSFEPIYSISTGGGGGSHIAAGTARHSVVSFWDVRSSSKGWSVHAPGNDPSPVYDVVLESSRFFGVTQSRAFVYDFVSALFLFFLSFRLLFRGMVH